MQTKKALATAEIIIICIFAAIPLFITFPFRVNIFLSWEGAYRMSEGQIPFRDFGIPLGGMYWVIPAIFFKIFGTQMITLIKAQVFINIISGLAFRSILKTLGVNEGVRFASVLLYCLSYSFINFWPWYNHSAIVFALIALSFVIKAIMQKQEKRKLLLSALGALFTVFSFFTKQDGGGLIFVVCCFLLLYYAWVERKWKCFLVYFGSTIAIILITVLFYAQYNFSYWFNHGQPPHNSRVSVVDMLNTFFSSSQWLKFYFFFIVLVTLPKLLNWKAFITNKGDVIFFLMTMGILCLATIFQVTSYTPEGSNIFFHSFAFAYLANTILKYLPIQISLTKIGIILSLGIMLWWSQLYWNYMQRIFKLGEQPATFATSVTGENIVNAHNARLSDKSNLGDIQGAWTNSNLNVLHKIQLPDNTSKGIDRLLKMDIANNNKDVKVLNMSELTFLAKEMPYKLETGEKYPLWYHLGVGMFNRELETLNNRIKNNYYDLVLFEHIPTLNNFYPFKTHEILLTNYQKIDSFPAPRSTDPGTIEIYIRK